MVESLGPLCTWWRGDPLPKLAPLAGLQVLDGQDEWLESLGGYSKGELDARRAAGHRPYVALIDGVPVAYGWVATRTATIGALDLSLVIPEGERYLWDFVTAPQWRGRGVYPRLLQAILVRERDAARFWIGYDAPNVASARGVAKAGFQVVVEIVRLPEGTLAVVPRGPRERVEAAVRLLGLPLLDGLSGAYATSASP